MTKRHSLYNGVINIYKEKGYTSFDAVAIVRKRTGSKAGHTGTLDPEAEGVLPVCVGKATKLCDLLMDKSKEYVAGIRLGVTTDTGDAAGTVLETRPVTVAREALSAVLSSFVPGYVQTPPMYSAIKINGKKLYELARNGIEIERKGRFVAIDEIELLEFDGVSELKIRAVCSKGTYIRSLAADIGEKLGCGAHMSGLVRTRTGAFTAENAHGISGLKTASDEEIRSMIMPIEDILREYRRVFAGEPSDKYLKNGNPIGTDRLTEPFCPADGERVLLFTHKRELFGFYRAETDKNAAVLKPVAIFYDNAVEP
jgi:tRNA pseudouridine55 synthase